jgi:hypothetical protein
MLLVLAPTASLPAQGAFPAPAEYSLVLRKLIDEVQLERRVLVKTSTGFVALPVDRIAEMYASRVWTGQLHPDSVAPRARWIRQESKRWLALLIRDLANLDATGSMPGAATGEYRRWYAPDGTWSMICNGRFPDEVRGQIGFIERVDTPDGRRLLRFDVYRDRRGLIATVNGTVEGNASRGERRNVQIPGSDFLEDVGTLTWNVIVTETKPAGGPFDGTIALGGELVYTGYEGRCHGLLEAG